MESVIHPNDTLVIFVIKAYLLSTKFEFDHLCKMNRKKVWSFKRIHPKIKQIRSETDGQQFAVVVFGCFVNQP